MTATDEKTPRLRQAEEFLGAGRYREAIDIYQELAAVCPEAESLTMAMAWAYYDAGRLPEAMVCFEELFERELARDVFTGFAYDELVRFYKAEQQYDQLVVVCNKAVAAQPRDMRLLSELAGAYLKAGRISASWDICQQLLALDSEAAETYCLLGEAHLAAGELNEAEKAFEQAVRIEPEAASNFYGRLAEGYRRIGEYQREEKALRWCLQTSPEDPLYHCRRGDCLIRQGRPVEAEAAYETALGLSPQSTDVFCYRWGSALAATHYHQEAIEVFRRVPPDAASYPRIRVRLAESYQALGRHDLAAEALAIRQG